MVARSWHYAYRYGLVFLALGLVFLAWPAHAARYRSQNTWTASCGIGVASCRPTGGFYLTHDNADGAEWSFNATTSVRNNPLISVFYPNSITIATNTDSSANNHNSINGFIQAWVAPIINGPQAIIVYSQATSTIDSCYVEGSCTNVTLHFPSSTPISGLFAIWFNASSGLQDLTDATIQGLDIEGDLVATSSTPIAPSETTSTCSQFTFPGDTICQVLLWTFVPPANVVNYFVTSTDCSDLVCSVKSRAPLGYAFQAFSALNISTSSATSSWPASLPTPGQTILATGVSSVVTVLDGFLAACLGGVWLFWLFHRLKHIEL